LRQRALELCARIQLLNLDRREMKLAVSVILAVLLLPIAVAGAHNNVQQSIVTDEYTHNHIMPQPGESLITLPVDALANAAEGDNSCPDCGPIRYVREGGFCWPIASAAPCVSGTCRVGTCVCIGYKWMFIG
jgi:hypothetical protein